MWVSGISTVKNSNNHAARPFQRPQFPRRDSRGTLKGGSMPSIKEMQNKKGIVSMKMRIFTMSLLALCLALFTMGGAMAQSSTTGSIEGTVTDPQGGAVPNATVTVSGSNLISAQTATTDDQGHYRVLNLPPGRYTITVAAVLGFAETAKSDVEVNLSRTTSADVQVGLAGTSASVTITDTSGAAVDVTANTAGVNVSSE